MTLQSSAQKQLTQFIEQIERIAEERKGISDDISDKFAEAKAVGFDVKVMRKVLQLRRKSKTERQEEEAVLDTYMHALGMIDEEHAKQMRDAVSHLHASEIKTPAEAAE